MGIEPVAACRDIGVDIGEGQNVQLLLAISSSGIDWEENRPCDDAADKGDHSTHS